jgi:hypothetical protein
VNRPLLYLDVDGPLNPFAAKPHQRPEGYETHRMMPPTWIKQREGMGRVKPLRVWLNPAHGPKLLALADLYDLVWATTWEHDANTHIGPNIGLPVLPVVEWDDRPRLDIVHGTFWKTKQLVGHAAGRSFVWVDDDFGRRDRTFVEHYHDGRALLHWVDPAKGLLDEDFETIEAWAIGLSDVEGTAA